MRFVTASALVLAAGVLAEPAAAAQRGYLFSVVGRVLSADQSHGTLVLQHGMLETMPSGSERCEAPPSALRALRPGMTITAVADTRHRPWRLRDVRPFRAGENRPLPPGRMLAMLETGR
ncbi:MAG TPA: hypothetical protein VHT53_03540 [Candidatus Elarobacter sp.]|nr:hypothetical protein [Candidatus Elarobacter sp.]